MAIIALLQLRLSEPKEGVLITGVKRDTKLLSQVVAQKESFVCNDIRCIDGEESIGITHSIGCKGQCVLLRPPPYG